MNPRRATGQALPTSPMLCSLEPKAQDMPSGQGWQDLSATGM
eukprot:CAMPEP_0115496436 /NCGR_PEP_ID=MMETSP0271-20121206/65766_1 /TAXON_ID=71861 /ORGANISM="Scrippsiella trochoidea, Strain CCMP3099" /LENGTH=41 /DNA_ID= /DNA_START= /DNA_END= /DNA_ORIENTATION=